MTPTDQLETTVLEEISDVLQEAGIEVQLIHAEAAPGQVNAYDVSQRSFQ